MQPVTEGYTPFELQCALRCHNKVKGAIEPSQSSRMVHPREVRRKAGLRDDFRLRSPELVACLNADMFERT